MKIDKAPVPLIVPNPDDPRLTERVTGTDQTGATVEIKVPVERPLTLYLNAQEIVTMMTIGDYPEYLALGYLLNQNMLKYDDVVTEVEYDDDLQVVVVRTEHHTNFEAEAEEAHADLGLRAGHRVRRSAGGGRKRRAAEGGAAHLLALPDDACDQHHALALSGGRRDPWLRAVQGRHAGLLHRGRRPPQRRRQDRGLDVSATASIPPTRFSTPRAG